MGVVTPEPERFTEGIRNEAAGVPEDVRVLGVITLEDVVERMVPHACMRAWPAIASGKPPRRSGTMRPCSASMCDAAMRACMCRASSSPLQSRRPSLVL